jgi:hypothetical protein
MPKFLVSILIVLGLSAINPALADDAPDAGAVIVPAFVDAGPHPALDAGPIAAPAPPSAAIHDPAEAPLAAWDDAKAARKAGWPVLVFFVLVAISKALAYGREKLASVPLIGKLAVWLSTGKRAVAIAALGVVGVAGYDKLMSGGSLTSALVAAGIAASGLMSSTTKVV